LDLFNKCIARAATTRRIYEVLTLNGIQGVLNPPMMHNFPTRIPPTPSYLSHFDPIPCHYFYLSFLSSIPFICARSSACFSSILLSPRIHCLRASTYVYCPFGMPGPTIYKLCCRSGSTLKCRTCFSHGHIWSSNGLYIP
jgi:hypothetical protein